MDEGEEEHSDIIWPKGTRIPQIEQEAPAMLPLREKDPKGWVYGMWAYLCHTRFPPYQAPCYTVLSRPAVSDPLWPCRLQPARLLSPWAPPGKNTGVGCHAFLQGIFPTQGSHPGLPHCRQILYHLSHQGSPPGSLLGESDKLHVQQLVMRVLFVYSPGQAASSGVHHPLLMHRLPTLHS